MNKLDQGWRFDNKYFEMMCGKMTSCELFKAHYDLMLAYLEAVQNELRCHDIVTNLKKYLDIIQDEMKKGYEHAKGEDVDNAN